MIPNGYLAPEDFSFILWPDGEVECTASHTAVENDGDRIVFVVTVEADPYAIEEYTDDERGNN